MQEEIIISKDQAIEQPKDLSLLEKLLNYEEQQWQQLKDLEKLMLQDKEASDASQK